VQRRVIGRDGQRRKLIEINASGRKKWKFKT
jgi:hypothetical protein